MKKFSALPLSLAMVENLDNLDYKTMTPIQEEAIPPILQKVDLVAQAKTGSGKTAAFGIGILHNLNFDKFRVQALILCPTRELAEQVSGELRRLARFRHNVKLLTLSGGIPMYRQELSLKHLAHIVVGTPGRVLKLLQRRSLLLDDLSMLVLDEADRMLDMGFIDQLRSIVSYAPTQKQVLLFSATFPKEIVKLTKDLLKNPVEVRITSADDEEILIEQNFYTVEKKEKTKALLSLLQKTGPESAIVFCNTKEMCRSLEAELKASGLQSLALHGDLEQKERTEVLVRFSNGSSRVLIATDVAARGLDIQKLAAVFNYDLPNDCETYIHRIGRTGRAGESGHAYSFVSSKDKRSFALINENYNNEHSLKECVVSDSIDSTLKEPMMKTLSINGGRKNKISPGDILGALTASGDLSGDDIGKIDRFDFLSFIAVRREVSQLALKVLKQSRIKGKEFKSRIHE